jgi:voltage-gated potassium channel
VRCRFLDWGIAPDFSDGERARLAASRSELARFTTGCDGMQSPDESVVADDRERSSVLEDLEAWLEKPMLVLSFVWLVLVVIELVGGDSDLLVIFGTLIWIAFLAEFALRFSLAPHKGSFLATNWLTAIALAVPALRLFRGLRFLRLARYARGARLVKVVGSANRGMNALAASLGRRGIGYVLATTVVVDLLGAAGMLAFEPAREFAGGFDSYPDALWWTSMLITTMGSQFWPQTVEGRVLCFLLSVYGLAIFGYLTASLATFFIGRESPVSPASAGETKADLGALREEIAALCRELSALAPRSELPHRERTP